MLKSERYTSKYLNKGKFNLFQGINEKVKTLKNQMSLFCKEHIFELMLDKNFQANYKLFKNNFITAWQTQALFQDIIKFYKNAYFRRIHNLDLSVQDNIKIEYYKKNGKHWKKGNVKSFSLVKKQTNLTKLVKYLVLVKNITKLPQEIRNLYDYFKDKGFEMRILRLVENIKKRIKNSVKLIEFTTGTYRICYSQNEGEMIFNDSNKKYKYWFRYRNKKKNIYIPLEINESYHHFNNIRQSQFFIKVNNSKIDIIGTKKVKNPDFQDFVRCEGIDLNVKHNFCTISDGKIFDYDRTYIKEFCSELKKLDKIGLKNINESQKKHLNKIVRKNEWYFKKLISEIVKYLVENKMTDIVMEDLDSFSKTFVKNEEFEIKYSRLVRLLRLSNIKNWFMSQCEKHGIRVHLTSPCYSSQQCPKCGSIHKENRKNQEEFECVECSHKSNADLNASINLKNRFSLDVLKEKLHNQDEFKRLVPKMMKKEEIKKILLEDVENRTKFVSSISLDASTIDVCF